jgi:hypothetical protein
MKEPFLVGHFPTPLPLFDRPSGIFSLFVPLYLADSFEKYHSAHGTQRGKHQILWSERGRSLLEVS